MITVRPMDRPHAQLVRFADAFPGFRTEIVEGSVALLPGWALVSDVAFPFGDAMSSAPTSYKARDRS